MKKDRSFTHVEKFYFSCGGQFIKKRMFIKHKIMISKYFYLLGLFLICACSAFAQKNKDRKIIVVASDTTNLFNRVVQAFYEKEYTIDNKDQQAGFISTKEKAIKAGFSTDVKMRALIKDSTITFTGEMRVNVNFMGQDPSFDPIYNWGMKGTPAKLSWQEMESIAKQFGDKITYSK